MATNNYWMKLWFDILRDPKMGMLPDRLWRRVIELFLLAGQQGEDGLLPDVPTIAWQLNKPVSVIITDLQKIAEVGIVQEVEKGKWIVVNFKKRNEPVSNSERAKDFRMRNYSEKFERKENVNRTQTERKPNVNETLRSQEEQKNRLTDLTTTTPPYPPESDPKFEALFSAYEKQFGKPPKVDSEEIAIVDEMINDGIREEEFIAAIREMDEKGYACPAISSARQWIMNNRMKTERKAKAKSRAPVREVPDRYHIPGYVPDTSNEIVIHD